VSAQEPMLEVNSKMMPVNSAPMDISQKVNAMKNAHPLRNGIQLTKNV